MKTVLAALALCLGLSLAPPARAQQADTRRVWFINIGASNNAGGGTYAGLTPAEKARFAGVPYWESFLLDGAFEEATGFLGPDLFNGKSWGAELSQCEAASAALPAQRLGMLKQAADGKQIAVQWNPGGLTPTPAKPVNRAPGVCYLELMDRIDAVKADQGEDGVFGALVVISWADIDSTSAAAGYQDVLMRLSAAVRLRTGNPDLPVVVARVPIELSSHAAYATVRAAQEAFVAGDPRAAIVDTDGLPMRDDRHFNGTGDRTLGQRVAAAWLGLVTAD